MPKVLLIDDEEGFRQVTRQALQRKGFETFEAADGPTGLDLARRKVPDLILCDVFMERMDGYAVLEELRRDSATAAIPVILITGMADDQSMRRGMNLGADDFLEKPFTPPQLYSAVAARLGQHQTIKQQAEKKLADLRANLTLALPHEMITPLNGIFGLADLLINDAANLSPEEISGLGQDILGAAERLHRLVQNFILYGQLEMHATSQEDTQFLRRKRTDGLAGLIRDRARLAIEKAGRLDDLDVEAQEGNAAMNQDMLAKCLDELLDNALKFSRAGQPIRVRGAMREGFYIISVQDHGIGMEPAQIAQIGAYSQFDRQRREQQGSGLGLAIIKRATELHSGTFEMTSQPGQGTLVTLQLPVADRIELQAKIA